MEHLGKLILSLRQEGIDWDYIDANDDDGICRRYMNGETIEAIGKSLNLGHLAVSRRMNKLNFHYRRHGNKAQAIPDEIIPILKERYEGGESANSLSRETGVSNTTIQKALVRHGVDIRSEIYGDRQWNWNGGRSIINGYLLVRIEDESPFREMATQVGYVLEHRLTMAKSLGRPLTKTETVHHINGDRLDNRLSNLQLRQGHHGKGIVQCCGSCGSMDIRTLEI